MWWDGMFSLLSDLFDGRSSRSTMDWKWFVCIGVIVLVIFGYIVRLRM